MSGSPSAERPLTPGSVLPASIWLRMVVLGLVAVALASPAVVVLSGRELMRDLVAPSPEAAARQAADELLRQAETGNEFFFGQLVGPADRSMVLDLTALHYLRNPWLTHAIEDVQIISDGRGALVKYTVVWEDQPRALPRNAAEILPEQIAAIERSWKLQAAPYVGRKGTLKLELVEDGRWLPKAVMFPDDDKGKGRELPLWQQRQPMVSTPSPSRPQEPAYRAFEALAVVGPDVKEEFWKTDVEVRDVPAEDVLKPLLDRLGLPPVPERELPLLRKPTSLILRGCSRLEAVEMLCQQVGLRVNYHSAIEYSRVTSSPPVGTQRSGLVTFPGPFRVEVVRVNEFIPEPTGTLQLHLVAIGLPPSATGVLPAGEPLLCVDRVIAPDGQDLFHAENHAFLSPRRGFFSIPNGLHYQETHFVPLRNLLRDVEAIAEVRGRIRLPLPTRVDVLRFESLRSGEIRQAGTTRLTVRSFSYDSVALATEGLDRCRLVAGMCDSTGKLEARPSSFSSLTQDSLVRVEGVKRGRTLVCKVVHCRDMEFEWRLGPISLRTRPPRSIDPLRFAGHDRPVRVSCQLTPATQGQPSANLNLENLSQKTPQWVALRLRWQDADGRLLADEPHTVRSPGVERLQPLQNGRQDQGALGPVGAARVEVEVTGVGFTDGTTWRRARP